MSRRFGADGPMLHRAGWEIIPIARGEKFPVVNDWPNGFTIEQIEAFAANGSRHGNIGLSARYHPSIDIDILNAECATAVEQYALNFFGPAPVRYGRPPKRLLMYRTEIPFSKAKVYLTDPLGNTTGDDGKSFAIEVLGRGQQYVVYGEHPDGFEYHWPNADGPGDVDPLELRTITAEEVNAWLEALPMHLPEGWVVRESSRSAVETNTPENALEFFKPPLEGWDAQRVRDEIVPFLDIEAPYDDYLDVGLALHHQFQGEPEGLALWEEIFESSSKHKTGYAGKKWKSFSQTHNVDKGPLTLASLIKKTRDAREAAELAAAKQAMEEARGFIEACTDDMVLRNKVSKTIKLDRRLDKSQREILAKVFNAKHKSLSGASLQIKDVRDLLGVNLQPGLVESVTGMPNWAKPWVYVTDNDKFFNLDNKEEVSRQGFKSKFNRFMPKNIFGGREQADQVALDEWGMPSVTHKAYMPIAGPVFTMFDLDWANLYRVDSVPEMPLTLTQEHQAAIDLVMQHFELYLPDERERRLLLSWIVHNVQHPGVKVRWSPYLHGPPGDGKSWFGELIGQLIGGQNVRTLNGSTLESNFTDWAMGYAVTIVEEMKQHGHNRHDVMNKIKPFITNTEVEIHPKGRPSYSSPNSTNYLLLSNYLDGAPVDDADRRYMFLSSAFTQDQAKRLTDEGYFARLFQAIQQHAGALRKHFLSLSLDSEFNADGRAPFTAAKATVVEMSKSDLEDMVEELVLEGAVGVCADVISSAHLTRALKSKGQEQLSTIQVKRMLSLKGYEYTGRRWWQGETCRIWTKRGLGLSEPEALARLEQTLGADFLQIDDEL